MIDRVLAIAHNTYREAVRARLLLGVLSLALASCAYTVVVAALSLHDELRVVADLGAATISLLGVVVAVLLGSTSLYRELELKTIFPILSRPVRRWEYVLGKYAGAMLTVVTFVAIDLAAVFSTLALETDRPAWVTGAIGLVGSAVLAALLLWFRRAVLVLFPWGVAMAVAMWLAASSAGDDRRLVLASAVLSLSEVAIVTAVATLFASFSSPMLTATFTTMIFAIGRSSEQLAHMPKKYFGERLAAAARGVSHVVPNLRVYVPARALLLGEVPGQGVWSYVGVAALYAVAYSAALLVVSAIVFRRRDFQ